MADKAYTVLAERGVIRITGEEARGFLQGIISGDVNKVAPETAIYSAFLTPQGKFLHDFFLAEMDGGLVVDCEGPRLADLKKRLSMYKLRSKATIEDASDGYTVAALFGDNAFAAFDLPEERGRAKALDGGLVFVDPRLPAAGLRAILPTERATEILESAGFSPVQEAEYDLHRIKLGLPDGSRDMPVEKAILLENGFDELAGVDWEKGCFLGQELTARTKYRGIVRKRLLPVRIDGPAPEFDTPVMAGETEAGRMRSARDGWGLALMRLEQIEERKEFTAGDSGITVEKPAWVAV